MPVTGGDLDYAVAEQSVTTTLTYSGDGRHGVRRHAAPAGRSPERACDLGSFPSVYGTARPLRRADAAVVGCRSRRPTGALDLSGLDDAERADLTEQVTRDVADLPPLPADTYFGGKGLYRTASCYQLAAPGRGRRRRPPRADEADRGPRAVDRPEGCASGTRSASSTTPSGEGGGRADRGVRLRGVQRSPLPLRLLPLRRRRAGCGRPRRGLPVRPVLDLLAADIASSG